MYHCFIHNCLLRSFLFGLPYLIFVFVCLTLGMTKLRDFFPKSLSAMSLLDDRGFLRVPGSDSKNRFDNVQLAILYRVCTVSSPLYRHLLSFFQRAAQYTWWWTDRWIHTLLLISNLRWRFIYCTVCLYRQSLYNVHCSY